MNGLLIIDNWFKIFIHKSTKDPTNIFVH
jgi:hypothetical protein